MTACGNIPEGAGPSGSANTNAPKERDSVVIAIGSEPETLDPTQGWGHGNAPIVQSTLVKYTSQLTFENDLATGYELSPDGLVWTFTIRDNAFFTDGEKVTASDVAFTLETAKAARGSVDLTYMESAVAKDGATVEITLSQPTPSFSTPWPLWALCQSTPMEKSTGEARLAPAPTSLWSGSPRSRSSSPPTRTITAARLPSKT